MRVIFMGTPEFAVPTLNAIVDAGHEVVLVVAQPDKRAGRGKKLTPPPVAQRAKELGLPLSQPRAIRSGSFPARVQSLKADVGVVLAYGRILTQTLLDAPTRGCINLHGSILPRWRGAAPMQAAILAGDTETGMTAQQMVAALDEGDVLNELRIPMAPDETAGTLHDKLAALSAELIVDTLARLDALTPVPQDGSQATYCGKIAKADGKLDWSQPAELVERRVRAMTPWPGGWVAWNKGPLKIKQVQQAEGSGAPGTVLATNPLVVACGEGALELTTVQAPGKRPVSGTDFANGARIRAGGLLEWPS